METKNHLLVLGALITAALAPQLLDPTFKVSIPFTILAGIAGACFALYFVL